MPLENEMQTDATQTSNPPSNAPPPSNNLNDALLKTELHPSAHLTNQHNDDERLHSIVHSHPCLSDESTNAKSSLKISPQFTDNLVPEVVIFHSASSTVPLTTNTPSCIDGNEGDGAVLIPKDEGELQCVFIENLARPFVSDALTSLLSKYGKIGEFWINRIKTHCYVSVFNAHSGFLMKYGVVCHLRRIVSCHSLPPAPPMATRNRKAVESDTFVAQSNERVCPAGPKVTSCALYGPATIGSANGACSTQRDG